MASAQKAIAAKNILTTLYCLAYFLQHKRSTCAKNPVSHTPSVSQPSKPSPNNTAVTQDDVVAAISGLVEKHLRDNAKPSDAHLVADPTEPTTVVSVPLTSSEFVCVSMAVSRRMEHLDPCLIVGRRDSESPEWDVVEDPDGAPQMVLMAAKAVSVPSGLTDFPSVMELSHASRSGFFSSEGNFISLLVAASHRASALEFLNALRKEASESWDPFRGRFIKVSLRNDGLMLSPEPWPSKEDNVVILPDDVSHEVSRNVLDHINAAPLLIASGLGAQRGVLLYGPPGTGKTSIIKSTIAEMRDKVTVLVPDSRAASNAFFEIYAEAQRYAPCVVVLEDIDAMASNRTHSRDLSDFLNTLDGVVSASQSLVLTLATTNDINAIDDAAKRPGRIDHIIEVPLPDAPLRLKILSTYINRVDKSLSPQVSQGVLSSVSLGAIGASGAVIKEIVRRAVLIASSSNSTLCDEVLLKATREVGFTPSVSSGMYL